MIDLRVFDLVIGLLVIQLLLTVVCFYDYAKHNREDGFEYLLASFFLPGIGIGVNILYLMRRKEFGTRDVWQPEVSTVTFGSGFTVETIQDRVQWNYKLPGRSNFRRRILYVVALQGGLFRVGFTGLLLVWVAVDEGPIVLIIIFLSFWYVVQIVGFVWDSRKFRDSTVGIDPRSGILAWDTKEIEFDSIKNVELVCVSEQYLARISHGTRRTNPKLLPIPDTQVEWFRNTLTDHGVEVQDRTRDDSNDRVIKQRMYAVPTELGLLLCAVVFWFFT